MIKRKEKNSVGGETLAQKSSRWRAARAQKAG